MRAKIIRVACTGVGPALPRGSRRRRQVMVAAAPIQSGGAHSLAPKVPEQAGTGHHAGRRSRCEETAGSPGRERVMRSTWPLPSKR